MNVQLSEQWDSFIRSRVQSGRYASEGEVLDEALRLLRLSEEGQAPAGLPETERSEPAWRRVLETMNAVPDEAFDRIPPDSSAQLDHYIYGTPKRPAP